MSFSRKVKEELSRQVSTARHCQIAELAAILSICGKVIISEKDEYLVGIHTENLQVARKYFTLVRKLFNISSEISVRRNANVKRNRNYLIAVNDYNISKKILQVVKLIDNMGEINENLSIINNLVVQNTCCKRAFIRGAFLASGSISDPQKTYHFEIVVVSNEKAIQLKEMICTFSLDAKIIQRKKYFVVYVKEGSQIVDLLNIMEAHIELMNLENMRIIKDMRNSINRQVNCETANIGKTVKAATKQLEDILYLQKEVGLSNLSEGLEDIAKIRMEQPESSLKELGEMLNPPIGKSGVNHRLRKISIIADNIRKQKEEI